MGALASQARPRASPLVFVLRCVGLRGRWFLSRRARASSSVANERVLVSAPTPTRLCCRPSVVPPTRSTPSANARRRAANAPTSAAAIRVAYAAATPPDRARSPRSRRPARRGSLLAKLGRLGLLAEPSARSAAAHAGRSEPTAADRARSLLLAPSADRDNLLRRRRRRLRPPPSLAPARRRSGSSSRLSRGRRLR